MLPADNPDELYLYETFKNKVLKEIGEASVKEQKTQAYQSR